MLFFVENHIWTQSFYIRSSFTSFLSIQSHLLTPETSLEEALGNAQPISPTILAQHLIDCVVKLYGSFVKIRETLLDTVNVLCIMAKETTVTSDTIHKGVNGCRCRSGRKLSEVVKNSMVLNRVMGQVVGESIKRDLSWLPHRLKVWNFEARHVKVDDNVNLFFNSKDIINVCITSDLTHWEQWDWSWLTSANDGNTEPTVDVSRYLGETSLVQFHDVNLITFSSSSYL